MAMMPRRNQRSGGLEGEPFYRDLEQTSDLAQSWRRPSNHISFSLGTGRTN